MDLPAYDTHHLGPVVAVFIRGAPLSHKRLAILKLSMDSVVFQQVEQQQGASIVDTELLWDRSVSVLLTSLGPRLSDRLRLATLAGDNCDAIPGSLEGELGSPPGVMNERANGRGSTESKEVLPLLLRLSTSGIASIKNNPRASFLYQLIVELNKIPLTVSGSFTGVFKVWCWCRTVTTVPMITIVQGGPRVPMYFRVCEKQSLFEF